MPTRPDRRSAAWLRHKDIIIELAINQGWSFRAVADHLRQNTELKDANERKVRLHIGRWKVRKKLNKNAVAAALRALIDSGRGWDETNTLFRVGKNPRTVSIQRILEYLRRKKVTDLVAWLADRPAGASTGKESLDVELLSRDFPESPDAGDSVDTLTPTRPVGTFLAPEEPLYLELLSRDLPEFPDTRDSVGALLPIRPAGNQTFLVPEEPKERSHSPTWQTMYDGIDLPPAPTPIPEHYITEQVITHAVHYSRAYLECPRQGSEEEPRVHMNTIHGLFGATMQEAIFLSTHDTWAAVVSFRSGFRMIEDILKAEHPMRIAQVFAIVSELLARASAAQVSQADSDNGQHQPLLPYISEKLLAYLSNLAVVCLGRIHPLTQIFSILTASANTSPDNPTPAHLVVTALKRMKDAFWSESAPPSTSTPASAPAPGHGHTPRDWRTLYLTERYADCLYHSRLAPGERHAVRALLLHEQTAHYGPGRANVLWTLTNVADDRLEQHRPAEAEALFQKALRCADEYLGGYARAKLRYAAYEGLAKVVLLRLGSVVERGTGTGRGRRDRMVREEQLTVAVGFLDKAEEEAEAWFPRTRRAEKVREWRKELKEEIAGLMGS